MSPSGREKPLTRADWPDASEPSGIDETHLTASRGFLEGPDTVGVRFEIRVFLLTHNLDSSRHPQMHRQDSSILGLDRELLAVTVDF